MMRPTVLAALAAALLTVTGAPAAQPVGTEDITGVWHRDDFRSIEIGPDDLTLVTPDGRWTVEPEVCPFAFEHAFEARTRADLIEFFGLGGAGLGLTDYDGRPIDDQLLAAWPDTDEPVPTLWSYCAAEAHGGALYFPTGADTLTAIAYGEGIGEVIRYHRQVPAPSHDDLSAYERREVQEALQRRGLYAGAIDGAFGPVTEAAIRAYQESMGAAPTGILTRSQTIELTNSP